MKFIGIKDEDFVNYKKPAMFVGFPKCSFKCGKENCQNYAKTYEYIELSAKEITDKYLKNDLTKAIVMGGLEPFDTSSDLLLLIMTLRAKTKDDIVIYTGYNKDEIEEEVNELLGWKNIIIKYGRYIAGQEPHYDKVLGVNLASDNQYAEKLGVLV